MKLNTAQRYVHALLDVPVDVGADLGIAAEQTRAMRDRYHPPHKMRGTPPRSKRRMSTVLAPRLFKGHRP